MFKACALNSPIPNVEGRQWLGRADSVPVRTSIGFGAPDLYIELTTFPHNRSDLSPCMPKCIQALGLDLSAVIEHTESADSIGVPLELTEHSL